MDFEKAIILIPMPVFAKDGNRRLHSEIGPAVIWRDGTEQYYLRGVQLDKDLWQSIVSHSLKSSDAFVLQNIEQRTIALSYIGGERLEKECQGIVVSRDEYGEIIKLQALKDRMGNPWTFYKAVDPSKGELAYLRTWPEVKTPKEAMTRAYRLQLFNLEYNPNSRT